MANTPADDPTCSSDSETTEEPNHEPQSLEDQTEVLERLSDDLIRKEGWWVRVHLTRTWFHVGDHSSFIHVNVNDFVFRPSGFIGLYVDDDVIVVDVERRKADEPSVQTQIEAFLRDKCADQFEKRGLSRDDVTFEFVEQDSTPVFSGKRGDALCFIPDADEHIAQQVLADQAQLRAVACVQKRCPRGYDLKSGTLGGFARKKVVSQSNTVGSQSQWCPNRSPEKHTSDLFIITARHVFNLDRNCSGELEGHYFSQENEERLHKVAATSDGILGQREVQTSANDTGTIPVYVDIAFIPINIPEADVPQHDDNTPTIFSGNPDTLKGRTVTKIGANVPRETEGTVLHGSYKLKDKGQCLLVVSEGRMSTFSRSGDSGSLVIRRLSNGNTEAIGIISERLPKWEGRQKNLPWRRNSCFVEQLLQSHRRSVESELNALCQMGKLRN